jgi:hypothetical protein
MAKVRQNSIHRPLRVVAFTEAGVVDFPTEFPNGVTFKMTSGATTTGTYAATFTGTDSLGRTETFPTGSNIEIVVVPAL